MPTVGTYSATAPSKRALNRPPVQIYINGQIRFDCYVQGVIERSGFFPSEATLVFPTRRFPHRPTSEGAVVTIFLNRAYTNRAIFRGYIQQLSLSYGENDGVVASCVDERARLNDDCCQYNYNEIDEDTDQPRERIGARIIANDIWTQYRDWQTSANGNTNYLKFDPSAWPRMWVGEQRFEDTPHGSALDQLVRLYPEEARRRVYVRRGGGINGSDILSAFRIGHGPVKNVFYATVDENTAANQWSGYPNCDSIEYRKADFNVIEKLTVHGRKRRVQSAFACTAAWDSATAQAVMANPDLYTVRRLEGGDYNPSYIPGSEWTGRRFALPAVTQTNPRTGESDSTYPRILSQLHDADLEESVRLARPVVRVVFPGESAEILTSGFSIEEGRWLVFNEPLARPSAATPGAAITAVFPTSVTLVATWEARARLELDDDLSSGRSVPHSRRRRLNNDNFFHDFYDTGAYSLQSDGTLDAIGSPTGVTVEDAELEEWGQARLKEMQIEDIYFSMRFPTCPAYFSIGDRIRLNGRILPDVNVTEIQYDLVNYNTLIVVSSGGD